MNKKCHLCHCYLWHDTTDGWHLPGCPNYSPPTKAMLVNCPACGDTGIIEQDHGPMGVERLCCPCCDPSDYSKGSDPDLDGSGGIR